MVNFAHIISFSPENVNTIFYILPERYIACSMLHMALVSTKLNAEEIVVNCSYSV